MSPPVNTVLSAPAACHAATRHRICRMDAASGSPPVILDLTFGAPMKRRPILSVACLAIWPAVGCTADVKETDDSTKIEVETPKVEIGDAPVDLDPRTDDDIDVDTPAPGDK